MERIFSLNEIDQVARDFARQLTAAQVITVSGEMGAGKTTFIQAICRQMGVTETMSSPTYSIIQQYKGSGEVIINHIDVYRLRDIDEAIQAGVEEVINSGDICFIEWSEKIADILPLQLIAIFIEAVNPGQRRITVKY